MMLRCPIDSQGHRSNYKVTGGQIFVNFGPVSPFPDDILKTAPCIVFKFYRSILLMMFRSPVDFKVIGQTSRSHWSILVNFGPVSSFPDDILTPLHALHSYFIGAFY